MDNLKTMQNTIGFYCCDLIEEIGGIKGFSAESARLIEVAEAAKLSGFDPGLVLHLGRSLGRAAVRIMTAFSMHPEDERLEKLYMRTKSMQEMCMDLLKDRIDGAMEG